ncbi:MAG: AAA family ATPase [Acidobacteriota bacterium]|jgi:hypothetical protein|nr:AAA family ATPase [Acidobacteriota bacterium]
MILLGGKVYGFGKLAGLVLEFSPGFNLVFAPNEGGKSTLQHFLLGMLYGQWRPDLKQQRRLQPWVERYKPWNGAEYGGLLRCRLGDGQVVELNRTFGKEGGRLDIRAATGGDMSERYERQRNGELLFAETHLGLPPGLFESLGVIRESAVADIGDYEAIRDRIANLAQSGNEDLSVKQALGRLEAALEGVGSERAPTKPYKQAQDLAAALKAELQEARDARMRHVGWVEDRNRLADEVADLERRLAGARLAQLAARRRETEVRIRTLEELEREIAGLREERAQAGDGGEFPADSFEKISQIEGALQNLDKYLGEAREDKAKVAAELGRLEEERLRLASYDASTVAANEEEITGWFVSWLNLTIRRDGAQKNQADLRATADGIAADLDALPEILRAPDVDWQRLGREASKEEQQLLWQSRAARDDVAQAQAGLAAVRRGMLWWRMLGIVLAAVAVAAVALKLGRFFEQVPMPYVLGAAAAAAALALACLFASFRWAAAVAEAKRTLLEFDLNMKDVQELKDRKTSQLDIAMAQTGCKDMDELMAFVEDCAARRRHLEDIEARLGEEGLAAAQLQEQADEYYQKLSAALSRAGLTCVPANLQFQVDALRTNMRLSREVAARHADCTARLDELDGRVVAMAKEREAKQAQMDALLEGAHVSTPEEFRAEGRKRGRAAGLAEKEESRAREFARLSEGRTLGGWRERLAEMDRQLESLADPVEGPPADDPATEREERALAEELSVRREEHVRAVERVRQAFAGHRPVADIEEDLALAERDFARLDADRQALGVALETIRELALGRQTELAPQLNAAVSQRFLRLCQQYDEVRVAPDFGVTVREAATGKMRPAAHLSRGAQDQLYFAMRFGILDLVSKSSEPCPCLLDEPFAAYDRFRLGEAFKMLGDEAERRQLVVFTCREELLELADRNDARVLRLAK